ncbi:AzlC family ABC transporter permease [Pelagibius litoralis]|uniref:AzlC family ABC transporter permease n=1 Tax=Pelagibius litoralis TaxID=374515 RepID=A0A967C826_9PROT|nr:AzlC family ABC transporter permease [Pelagibius litoralis]NIA68137.1 AzlC family ABC transporter permease [Pelagibius litoralis]
MSKETMAVRPGGPLGGDFSAGTLRILPLLVAVVVYGLLFGTLAAQKGLSPLETALMSAIVFAGASQFVAVEIWTSPPAVVLLGATALMVNLRHVLMGAALAPFLKGWSRGQVYGGLFFMADENWAFALQRSAKTPLTPGYYFGLALPLYAGWIACTTLGAIFGGFLQDPARYGLDFAFTAVFLTLLTGLWKGRRSFLPWGAAALAAVAGHLFLPGVWYIALGGLAGALVGALATPLPKPQEQADAA